MACCGNGEAEGEQEAETEQAHGDARRAGDVGVDGGEQERPRRDSDQCHGRRPHGEQGGHLLAGDAEERAEEERVETVENAVVEADKEEAECERKRLQRADCGRLGAVASARAGDPGERERAEPAEAEVADCDRERGETRGSRSGEGDHGERVAGERLPA